MDTNVLIVGAGPTGLMLANQLARRSVPALIVDRHAGPSIQTKALGVQARTLEIYAHLGIADRALEMGKPATGADLWTRGRRAARLPLGDIGEGLSPYPYMLVLGQDDNERLLGGILTERGISIQWNSELVALEQKKDHVAATLKGPDGATREVRAAWVAGCDGARSTVRELNRIEFQGAPYEHVFFVADTRMTGPMVPGELNVYLWRDGFHLFFPMRGTDHWRIVGILPEALRGRETISIDDVIPSIRHEAGSGLSFQECSWLSTYRIHHRRAQSFRDGRCFLLGDAAHIHSPVGAQGMNTGLQDAYNLAWKLALVVTGRAGAPLLDSYEAERIPVARRLLASTDRFFSIVVANSRLAGLARTRVLTKVMGFAMHLEPIRRLAFRTISQIGISYRESPLSTDRPGLSGNGPRAGDRFPWLRVRFSPEGPEEDLFGKLDDTRFTRIVIGRFPSEEGDPALGDLVRTLAIPSDGPNATVLERARIPRRASYLLRPDGHIGIAGTDLDAAAMKRYLSERIHLRF